MQIPDLGAKLNILYRQADGSSPSNHTELAKHLGLAGAASISNWITGSGGAVANSIPDKHMDKFCQTFSIRADALAQADLTRFRQKLVKTQCGWHDLLLQSEHAENLFIHINKGNNAQKRGLIDPLDATQAQRKGAVTLGQDEAFSLSIRGPKDWHYLIFLDDKIGTRLIRPHELSPYEQLRGERNPITIPEQDQFLPDWPYGIQCFVCVAQPNSWPREFVQELKHSTSNAELSSTLVNYVNRLKRYEVSAAYAYIVES